MMYFLYGLIGFAGYESLRVYGIIRKGKKVLPTAGAAIYIFIIIFVGVFSGVVAHVFSGDDIARAIYMGFTMPTSVSAIASIHSSHSSVNYDIEDLDICNVSSYSMVKMMVIRYFSIWG